MPDDSTLYATLMGGALALAGSLASQLLTLVSARQQRTHERDMRQRQRLEQMADAITATIPYIQILGQCQCIEDLLKSRVPAEARKITMIAYLYFPELRDAAVDYSNYLNQYYIYALECWRVRPAPSSVGAAMVMLQETNPKLKQFMDRGMDIRNELDNQISKVAARYSHA